MIYQDSSSLPPLLPKGNSKFENTLMLHQTINFVEISNHTLKCTRDYNGDMLNKRHSARFRHIDAHSDLFRRF